jgi:hypothetical protein
MVGKVNCSIDSIVTQAVKQADFHQSNSYNQRYNAHLVEKAVTQISRDMRARRRFLFTTFKKGEDLCMELDRFHRELIILGRISDTHAEREHPEVFGDIRFNHLGKKIRLRITAPRFEDGRKLQSDAKTLDEAYKAGEKLQYYIGLNGTRKETSEMRVDRNFQVLLCGDGSRSKEVTLQPVVFSEANRRYLRPSFSTALNELGKRSYTKGEYLLPHDVPLNRGFLLVPAPETWISGLERASPLASVIEGSRNGSIRQYLPLQDRLGVGSSLADGCFRFLDSNWLNKLDAENVRAKRAADGSWMTTLSNGRGDRSTSETLHEISAASLADRGHRDLTRQIQIFRLGLVLTELALKVPIDYIEKENGKLSVIIRIQGQDEPMDASEIAAEVQRETNSRLYGDMVFFCLSTLSAWERVRDDGIDEKYYGKVFIP